MFAIVSAHRDRRFDPRAPDLGLIFKVRIGELVAQLDSSVVQARVEMEPGWKFLRGLENGHVRTTRIRIRVMPRQVIIQWFHAVYIGKVVRRTDHLRRNNNILPFGTIPNLQDILGFVNTDSTSGNRVGIIHSQIAPLS